MTAPARLQARIRADLARSEHHAALAEAAIRHVPSAAQRRARRFLAEAAGIRRQTRAVRS